MNHTNKRQIKLKGKSRIDNQEKLATLAHKTQDKDKQKAKR